MKYFLSIFFSLIVTLGFSQKWVEKMNDPSINFYEVKKAYEQEMGNKSYERGKGMKQYERWAWFTEQRLYPSGQRVDPTIAYEEGMRFRKQFKVQQAKASNWNPLGPTQWTSVSYNPGIGRINCIRLDPSDSTIIYAGTPSGGVWKSTDAGINWTPLADDIPVIGVTDVAINHLNTNTVYIATGDGFGGNTYSIGLLKSLDGGSTWNNTGFRAFRSQNLRMRRLLIHPTNPDTLWVATTNGLWRTDDGGTGWRQVLTGDIRSVKMKPGDTSTVYACTDQFYRSIDGGNTFVRTSSGMPLAQQVNRMEIAVSENDPNVVYAVAGKQLDASFLGLWKSTNSGLSFTQQTNSSTPNLFDYSANGSDSTRGQSWYDLAIAANPQNANEIYVGGINVWKSTDGGQNWTIKSHWVYPSNIGYTHADIHSLEYYDNTLYCGSDGGIYNSFDGGDSWNDLSDGMQVSQFYRMGQTEQDSTVLMAGAQDNGCNYRTTSGVWRHVLGADGMDVAIDPTSANTIYYEWQNGGISRSFDGGINRTYIASRMKSAENAAWVTPFQLDPNNSQILYAGYENVWVSPNRGSSWARISNFNGSNTLYTLEVAPANSSVVYTSTNDNNLRKTTNLGISWSNISAGLPNLAITDIMTHPTDADSLWITFSGYDRNHKVYTSSDGGANWRNNTINLPNLPINSIAVDTVTGIEYVGTDIGVYYRDQTQSPFWNAFNAGLPNVIVNEVEIHYSSSKLRAATYGRGIWESDLERPVITTINEISPEIENSGFTIYPNPSRGIFFIEQLSSEFNNLQVFNTLGAKVIEQNLQVKSSVNLGGFENGLYFFQLSSPSGKIEKVKVIKQ